MLFLLFGKRIQQCSSMIVSWHIKTQQAQIFFFYANRVVNLRFSANIHQKSSLISPAKPPHIALHSNAAFLRPLLFGSAQTIRPKPFHISRLPHSLANRSKDWFGAELLRFARVIQCLLSQTTITDFGAGADSSFQPLCLTQQPVAMWDMVASNSPSQSSSDKGGLPSRVETTVQITEVTSNKSSSKLRRAKPRHPAPHLPHSQCVATSVNSERLFLTLSPDSPFWSVNSVKQTTAG